MNKYMRIIWLCLCIVSPFLIVFFVYNHLTPVDPSISEISNDSQRTEESKVIEPEKVLENIFTEDTEFSYCDGISQYENSDEYEDTAEIKLLVQKLTEREYDDTYPNANIDNIGEYCRSSDGTTYIFWAYNDFKNARVHLFSYDTTWDTLREVENNIYFWNYIENSWYISDRNYWDRSLEKYFIEYIDSKKDISGFWVKNGSIVPFSRYWVTISWHAESAPWVFVNIREYFSQKTREYCSRWLTPEGKLSICFVDIFYDYNFVDNSISESRICSYYIDDMWELQTLEKCIDFTATYKWYTLKSKAKWLDFYQSENGEVSVLELDLHEAKISFAGLNTKYKKEKATVTLFPGEQVELETEAEVDLEYEQEDSELQRFNTYFASDMGDKTELDWRKYDINAFVNGQFFLHINEPKTGLSFPIKSDWKIVTSYIDNEIPKRTFVIDDEKNAQIFEWYKPEYLENDNYKELIVAFTPEVTARREASIWRTYIWLKDAKTLVFFIAKNRTQAEMDKLIEDYGIKREDIIMMDGGPSSQFSYFDNQWPWSEFEQYYGEWEVPHYFIIYND